MRGRRRLTTAPAAPASPASGPATCPVRSADVDLILNDPRVIASRWVCEGCINHPEDSMLGVISPALPGASHREIEEERDREWWCHSCDGIVPRDSVAYLADVLWI